MLYPNAWVHTFLQRLLVLRLVSIGGQEGQRSLPNQGIWSNEIYGGEFNDLGTVKLLCSEGFLPITPRIRDFESNESSIGQMDDCPTRENLQVSYKN